MSPRTFLNRELKKFLRIVTIETIKFPAKYSPSSNERHLKASPWQLRYKKILRNITHINISGFPKSTCEYRRIHFQESCLRNLQCECITNPTMSFAMLVLLRYAIHSISALCIVDQSFQSICNIVQPKLVANQETAFTLKRIDLYQPSRSHDNTVVSIKTLLQALQHWSDPTDHCPP